MHIQSLIFCFCKFLSYILMSVLDICHSCFTQCLTIFVTMNARNWLPFWNLTRASVPPPICQLPSMMAPFCHRWCSADFLVSGMDSTRWIIIIERMRSWTFLMKCKHFMHDFCEGHLCWIYFLHMNMLWRMQNNPL